MTEVIRNREKHKIPSGYFVACLLEKDGNV